MNTIFFHKLILVIALVFITSKTNAQNNQIRGYTLEDGLPQSQVFDVVQDRLGYLWVGTQGGGLTRFDGTQFKVWNEKDGLLSNYVQTMTFLDDRLYIGTKEGLSIKSKNRFLNVPSAQINTFFVSVDNTLILGTNDGLYKFHPDFEFYSDIWVEKIEITAFGSNTIVNDIIFDGKWFWIATNKGVWKTDSIDKKPNQIQNVYSGNFISLLQYKSKVFAASFNNGIMVFEEGFGNPEIIPGIRRINDISLLNENEIWVATDNSGITIVNAETFSFSDYVGKKNGLKVSHIRKCIEDKQDNIWIASSGGGLYRYFKNDFKHYDDESGLKGNRVYAVHHRNGTIWTSNSEAGLTKVDSLGVQAIEKDSLLQGVKIKTIATDYANNVWTGSDGKGVFMLREYTRDSIVFDTIINVPVADTIKIKENYIRRFTTEEGLPSNWIKTLRFKDGYIWGATYSNGIFKFPISSKGKNLARLKLFGIESGLEDLIVNDIRFDSEGLLWYGTKDGHIGYISNDKVNHIGKVLNVNTSIGSIIFNKDNIYLGTSGKGIWWSKKGVDLKFQKLKGAKELYSENIYQLIFDNNQNLWAGTERGVDKIELDENSDITDVIHFGRNDGFLGIETCLNAVDKDTEGNLWFGALFGLTRYKPSAAAKEYSKPTLSFENIEVSYKDLDSINLLDWTNSQQKLSLKPSDNNLAFSYRTVDISNPSEIAYRYKLNDNQWSPWSEDNKITLANLDYGEYVFTAQSRNMSWKQSEPISFNFQIERPLHKTKWFQWLAYSVLGFVLLFIIWLYVLRIKKKNREERKRLELENHLLSLEHKALQLQMNPHFIFNVLNGVKAMSVDDKDKMNTTINKFARLLRATLNNSRENSISLKQEIETLTNYIEVEQLMAAKTFNYDIALNLGLDPEEIWIPPMLVQPFVENAIRHGILPVQWPGKLSVLFSNDDEFLYCEVVDNGCGIDASQNNKGKTDHQSMALTVTKERIVSMTGKNTLKIEDLGNANKEVSGTKVTFKIPLVADY